MSETPPAPSLRVTTSDDEPLARRGLQQLLAPHPECLVVAECRNGRETLRALRTLRPDIVFLDIQMPALNGFELLEAIGGERLPVVIFATAYDEFAIRAFDAEALDYLLKPVSQERFDTALDRARERLRANHALRRADQLMAFFGREGGLLDLQQENRSIVVSERATDIVLDPAEIDWIEAEDYYAAIHALGKRHLVRESLSSLERRLDPRSFVRVHRSAIVRLDRVRELRGAEGSATILLRDGTEIPVSRRRRERVAALIRKRA